MNIHHIEENINQLSENINEETFIYDFLRCYGSPKASITRLQKGDLNISKEEGEVLWNKKIFFKADKQSNLLTLIDGLKRENRILKHKPIFIIVTDFNTVLALDLKVGDTLEIPIKKITKHFQFFLPLIGMEKTKIQTENLADVKAAEKLGKLYDVLVEQNNPQTDADEHALNVFLSRLLFCFFAEDTHIFPEGLFTNSITSHTQPSGSDLSSYLGKLFTVLNSEDRQNSAGFLAKFPYVNGGLFERELPIPRFNAQSYKIIVECGSLDWACINPDIFGSMIQSVANPEIRSDMGMHYTSVANIMKVIEPLFLNELKSELEAARANKKKLRQLLDRLYRLKIFDPACGSGNFLIISYKELCAVEIAIYQRLNDGQMAFRLESGIKTNQFYGIEINDFACETAKLSLWLAEHQMNLQFEEIFGVMKPTLPLKDGGNITCSNAIDIDWNECCPCNEGDKIYVLGNPPYRGAKFHDEHQKRDIKTVFGKLTGAGTIDYISCWIGKASKYIEEKNAAFAFVSTNSICQGEQVAVLWPFVLGEKLEISFAHRSFKWTNNARNNAGVACIIVSLRNKCNLEKIIFTGEASKAVKNINAYLIDEPNIFIKKSSKPMNGLPPMGIGNKPIDGGQYLFSKREKEEFLRAEPAAEGFFYRWYGAREFLNGLERWCILPQKISDKHLEKLPQVQKRVEAVRAYRMNSISAPTRAIADTPRNFHVECFPVSAYIVIPALSSERKNHIPVGFFDETMIASNLLNVVSSSDPFVFGLISSRLHLVWVKAVAGRMGTNFRYSSSICYNTFPVPTINSKKRLVVEEAVFKIVDNREKYSQLTLAQLYDPDKMPASLSKAHEELDKAIEKCYRKREFRSDEERLKFLFSMYMKNLVIENQKDK